MIYREISSNKWWSVLMVAAMAALLVTVGYFIGGAFGLQPLWLGAALAAGLAVVLTVTSYYGGGGIILALSGARRLQKQDNPQLFNVVEEMSIAAGLPMPAVYMIEDSAPNAFATGRNPHQSALCVTSGLVSKLNRDELTGVIAHEMSHIRNYDILLMMMLAVMVGTIALIGDAFRRYAWFGGGRRRSSSDGGAGAILLIIALVLAILAPLAAKLVQLAASRRREYLADASGALLTRYPAGLSSALRKISDDPEVLEAANRATQALYIVNPMKVLEKRAASLLSTHPPLEERIKRLDAMAYLQSRQDPQASGPA